MNALKLEHNSILGPTDKLFERFCETFPAIQVDPLNFSLWEWPGINHPHHIFLTQRAQAVLVFLQEHNQTTQFGRDDYKELCELIIKYLGGQVRYLYSWLNVQPCSNNMNKLVINMYTFLQVFRNQIHDQQQGQDDFNMRRPGALHHTRFFGIKFVHIENCNVE